MDRTATLRFSLFLVLMGAALSAAAQKKKKAKRTFEPSPRQELIYEDRAYLPAIRTVQFHPAGKENRLPVYLMGGGERLRLSFDDLRADIRNYYIAIEHCNQDWRPSRTSVLDYVDGHNEDRIEDYSSSKSTVQPYTHYALDFPTEYVRPKLAGNYLLKVYEDADKERLVLTRRFYVLNDLVSVGAQVWPSRQAASRLKNQKLDISLSTGLTVNNPQRDLSVLVRQNQRPDNQLLSRNPNFATGGTFRYDGIETFDFRANDEFRFVDLRSFRVPSERVREIIPDSVTRVVLFADEDRQGESYAGTYDENGLFFIRNRDLNHDELEADYADVVFSLKTSQNVLGNIYLVGGFNGFRRADENRLVFDVQNGVWTVTVKLKQGLYDYEYVLENPDGELITDAFCGTHFQTGNDYQIFVYNRRQGTYWDELVGFAEMGINNSNNLTMPFHAR